MKVAIEQTLLPYPFNNSLAGTEDVTEILTKYLLRLLKFPPINIRGKRVFKDKSEDKKAQSKGKKGPKGKQTEETNQEQTKDNLPAENGEAKSEEVKLSVVGEKQCFLLGQLLTTG
uniref:Uncharacterized protein n=1 Tax=Otus sunia TaxID=257818 RepID=A0A8C8B8S4_9STRI